MSASSSNDTLSKYTESLEGDFRDRYLRKCLSIGVQDPYNLPGSIFKNLQSFGSAAMAEVLPNVAYHDVYNYLVHQQSCYTGKELKAYKSLEAYKYFVAGWVSNIQLWKVPHKTKYLVMSKVAHSQSISSPPLKPWIVVEKDGTVETAHCTCMAGLGEACSHIAATLFAIEAAVKMLKERACTSLPCTWLEPSGGCVNFAEGNEIDFTSPSRKRTLPMCREGISPKRTVKSRDIPVPTFEEASVLYDAIKATGVRSAILAVVPKYAAEYIPKAIALNLPEPLSQLYKDEWSKLSYPELAKVCEDVFFSIRVTKEQAECIESETRLQSKTKTWFQQRCGRITASNFKSACRTDPTNPSASLIKRICYPEAFKFQTSATRWGCEHEEKGRSMYADYQSQVHEGCEVSDAGLYLHPSYPHLGASPDGTVKCKCCGAGILEVKCPFCLKSCPLESTAELKGFCLQPDAEGKLRLDRCHQYYYQVQLQLLLTEARYCDFIVWRQDGTGQEIFIERIQIDNDFLRSCLSAAQEFYLQGILPELLGKWYTQSRKYPPVEALLGTTEPCYCQNSQVEGNVLVCQSGIRRIKNFHQTCLGLKNLPKRKWLCPDCRVHLAAKKRIGK